ncbi:RagB/SusD family nutrient uptake outer membrane protein [Sunxiuqinia sp. A32]|uniref:RagB/SusD family nutrient uptake outer membrane protein n=1 Tax=Sunxiuqinia sp. A32 TaxID=3461496 RepID=UPI0040458F1F
MKRVFKYILILIVAVSFTNCEGFLDETVYNQLAPDNLLKTKEGIESVLTAAYAETSFGSSKYHQIEAEWSTDISWQSGGGENVYALLYMNFTIDASEGNLFSRLWSQPYQGIRNCNIILDNIDDTGLAEDVVNEFKAEARFLRAVNYIKLYESFGPTVLRTSDNDELSKPRATEEEILNFIETELVEAIPVLPDWGNEEAYGRITKDAAKAVLCKFYLNNKEWQKSASLAQEIISSGKFDLYPEYVDLFKVENERNSEFIYVRPRTALSREQSLDWMASAFPAGFMKDPKSGLTFQSNWKNFGSQYRLYDGWTNSFEDGDKRKELILTKYIRTSGDTINLLGNNDSRSFKFWPDPNADGAAHGNDWPVIRYADILLSLAEAQNELNGPTQEALDLINQVRNRAGLADITLSQFSSKDELRDHLVKERGWELYTEGHRRVDLIRMGKFIEYAVARGKNAKAYHVRYPIPQRAIDSDSALEQNEGY